MKLIETIPFPLKVTKIVPSRVLEIRIFAQHNIYSASAFETDQQITATHDLRAMQDKDCAEQTYPRHALVELVISDIVEKFLVHG